MNILKTTNTTMTKEVDDKVKIFGKDYNLNILYKNIKNAELYLEDKNIQIYLPNKYKKIENNQIIKLVLDKMYDEIAKQEVEKVMEKTRIMLGYAPEDYKIQRIGNSLSKCSKKDGIIIINPEIVKYKKEILEYTVLHEYCQLKHRTNTKKFTEMLSKYMPSYQKCVFELAELYD